MCVLACRARVSFAINLAGYRERSGDTWLSQQGWGWGAQLGFPLPWSWGSAPLSPASLASSLAAWPGPVPTSGTDLEVALWTRAEATISPFLSPLRGSLYGSCSVSRCSGSRGLSLKGMWLRGDQDRGGTWLRGGCEGPLPVGLVWPPPGPPSVRNLLPTGCSRRGWYWCVVPSRADPSGLDAREGSTRRTYLPSKWTLELSKPQCFSRNPGSHELPRQEVWPGRGRPPPGGSVF